jgi:predicted MFS family arabinose efflux permease
VCVGICVVISMLFDPKIKERVKRVVLFRVILLILMISMLLIVMLKDSVEARYMLCCW